VAPCRNCLKQAYIDYGTKQESAADLEQKHLLICYESMLGIDLRTARATWTVFLVVLLIALIYLAREAILMFVASIVLAYILSPLVDFAQHLLPLRLSHTLALVIVFAVLLLVIITVGVWLGGRVVDEASSLVQRLPEFVRQHRDLDAISVPSWLEPYKARILQAANQQVESIAERIVPLLQKTFGGILSFFGTIGFAALIPVLSFLFLKDAANIRDALLLWMPEGHQRVLAHYVMRDTHVMLVQYIRSLVILSIATSVTYLIFFEIIGLPYAVLLSAMAAPLEFIPFIGPLLGTISILAVAIFTGYSHIWWIIIFFILYRAFQDYVLQPYLMSSGIELHPLVVVFGAVAGEQLGGLWGMFLSVPILAGLRVLLTHVRRVHIAREQPEIV
jgi:predicted PurR-regulated permease PerM